MTKKRPGPAPGVRLIEVSVLQRCPLGELTVYILFNKFHTRKLALTLMEKSKAEKKFLDK